MLTADLSARWRFEGPRVYLWPFKTYLVGQVGLEPTIALSTGFTVRGDTNYTVLTHMVEPAGVEPATLKFSVWRSALR